MGEAAAAAHVLVVSFPGQGHVNPMLRLAKRVAANGLLVTFSSSADIGHRIYASTGATLGEHIPVGAGHLRFDFFPDGWEVDDPRRRDIDEIMDHLKDAWPTAISALLRRQADEGRPVSCVVVNPFLPEVLDVVSSMGIPCAVLWVQSCAVFSVLYHYFHSLATFPTGDYPDAAVNLPGLPALKADELPSLLLPTNPFVSFKEMILDLFGRLSKARWVLANSFDELERDAIAALAGIAPIVPVGPLVDDTATTQSTIRGDLWTAAEHCMDWLGAQAPCTVVYVSLGSVAAVGREELEEMAEGLLAAGRPFLWVVRDSFQELLPDGFTEAAAAAQGMLVSWSPQERVLAHGSVACFVTHCGWNSTLEALTSGVPVVAYPQWGDQVPNAKFLVDVYGVGVRLKGPVKREKLAGCVAEVTSGPRAEEIRRSAARWREAARSAVADGGLSDRNIKAFADEVRSMACSGGTKLQTTRAEDTTPPCLVIKETI